MARKPVKRYPGIVAAGEGRWRVTARVRRGGRIYHRQETITGTQEAARRLFEDFKKELREGTPDCSLTLTGCRTFKELADFYLARKKLTGSTLPLVEKMVRDLGAVELERFGAAFDRYIQILRREPSPILGRPRTDTTINRYIVLARLIFGFACKIPNRDITGIRENPLMGFDLAPEPGRDRVWTAAEKERIFATLQRLNSPLYWPVYFCQWNPIRKGDLFRLTRDNLDMMKPWVHFYPSKTRKRKPRETCLVCIDSALVQYFKSLPPDCPLLFPDIRPGKKWRQFGGTKRHWATVMNAAQVQDFKFHDMKHCSETFMLDSGFVERDLMNLGIQYDRKMIERYYHKDAHKGLEKWRKIGQCDSECDSEGGKIAYFGQKTAIQG